ncbi:AmmeMemoRadiSam system protein B [bacterium]|nr:AmmeMemoRadiSam system protein B [bacterium]
MKDNKKRKPAVAGQFYPANAERLKSLVERMVEEDQERKETVCVVSPHAGLEFSGYVAGAVFSSVELPSKFILLGPNHRNVQSGISIMKEGVWETPLGDVPVDDSLAESVMSHSNLIQEDTRAHFLEHSLEVQLPFLQYYKNDISIVPFSIAPMVSYEELEELGTAVASSIQESSGNVLIVASTDMSHFVSQETAKKKDFLAIEQILNLNPRGLYEVVTKENISMCGFQPTTSALVASKKLGAQEGSLIKYQTSGDIIGNFNEVVGYAGVRIT